MKKWVMILIVGMLLIAGMAAADTAATETEADVTQYGAVPDDERDDLAGIQAALDVAKETEGTLIVRVPKGKYLISNTLIIYSDTQLILDSEAEIACMGGTHQMLLNFSKTGDQPGGYGRSKNITVKGGTWDGKGQTGDKDNNLLFFVHASNIKVQNATFKNCCGNHFVELNGVSGGVVSGCTFRDFVRLNGKDYDSEDSTDAIATEALQLDYCSGIGTNGGDAPADKTICQNITVTGNTFINCMCCVGNHHEVNSVDGLTISNNTFSNIHKHCINYFCLKGAKITGNKATNVKQFIHAHLSDSAEGAETIVESNTIDNTEAAYQAGKYAMQVVSSANMIFRNNEIKGSTTAFDVDRSSNITISGNTISDMSNTGILVMKGSNCQITGNSITKCERYTITVYNGSSGTIEDNTYDLSYGILDNGFMTRGVNHLIGYETEPTWFFVYYHADDNAEASEQVSHIEPDQEQPLLTTKELGFGMDGTKFTGWKAFRQDTRKWRVINAKGNRDWEAEVPEGGSYILYKDGATNLRLPAGGVAHLYAQWENKVMDILGDVNEDEVVDGRDAVRLKKYLDGEIDPESGAVYKISQGNADVNKDGTVDAKDLERLLEYFAGAIEEL